MTADTMTFLPFHADELAAQALAGKGAGRAPIRPFMPEQHREFFPLLPYLFTATPDSHGWPMASVLTGPYGFVSSPDPTTLRIASRPRDDDPATSGFVAGAEIGLIGIDLTTRRRNRANGRIVATDNGVDVHITQSFGNCAQYIQTRAPVPHPVAATVQVTALDGLDDAARAIIATADTFFVASRSRNELGTEGGLDMSHRGGRPGFVDVQGNKLTIPDFRGNRFFNTLGNLLGDPRAGLLFIDFASGDLLQLQGNVTIEWHPDGRGPSGTERLWHVDVERGWLRRGVFPFRWQFGDYAPTTLATGMW
ncbi:pyridoxamine 5'-phosphate oxidase family protein [Reyranella sp.]|uniref:pyridoxamine 5'-phosphate oxidase family protein n=1 Tax=Reyranella sp. TaxID=1929291 RepID=UPI0025E8F3FD|nr:pyridoxamine 5'-phosphate oxidase family protein [Reyranella sp.]